VKGGKSKKRQNMNEYLLHLGEANPVTDDLISLIFHLQSNRDIYKFTLSKILFQYTTERPELMDQWLTQLPANAEVVIGIAENMGEEALQFWPRILPILEQAPRPTLRLVISLDDLNHNEIVDFVIEGYRREIATKSLFLSYDLKQYQKILVKLAGSNPDIDAFIQLRMNEQEFYELGTQVITNGTLTPSLSELLNDTLATRLIDTLATTTLSPEEVDASSANKLTIQDSQRLCKLIGLLGPTSAPHIEALMQASRPDAPVTQRDNCIWALAQSKKLTSQLQTYFEQFLSIDASELASAIDETSKKIPIKTRDDRWTLTVVDTNTYFKQRKSLSQYDGTAPDLTPLYAAAFLLKHDAGHQQAQALAEALYQADLKLIDHDGMRAVLSNSSDALEKVIMEHPTILDVSRYGIVGFTSHLRAVVAWTTPMETLASAKANKPEELNALISDGLASNRRARVINTAVLLQAMDQPLHPDHQSILVEKLGSVDLRDEVRLYLSVLAKGAPTLELVSVLQQMKSETLEADVAKTVNNMLLHFDADLGSEGSEGSMGVRVN